jgi:hypothetical protein
MQTALPIESWFAGIHMMGARTLGRCWSILSQETLGETSAGRCAGCFDDPAPRSEPLIQDNCAGIDLSSRSWFTERDNISPMNDTMEQDFRNVVLESIDALERRGRYYQPCAEPSNVVPPGLINGIDLVEDQHSRNVGTADACQHGVDDTNTLLQVWHSGIDNVQEEVRITGFRESRTK